MNQQCSALPFVVQELLLSQSRHKSHFRSNQTWTKKCSACKAHPRQVVNKFVLWDDWDPQLHGILGPIWKKNSFPTVSWSFPQKVQAWFIPPWCEPLSRIWHRLFSGSSWCQHRSFSGSRRCQILLRGSHHGGTNPAWTFCEAYHSLYSRPAQVASLGMQYFKYCLSH